MPRSTVLLSPTPIDGDAVARAAGAVWSRGERLDPDTDAFVIRPLDDGAALQALLADVPVLTVLRPRLLPTGDEVARLLPSLREPVAPGSWWTDAYTPWSPEGEIGVAILNAVAEASRAHVVHQGLAVVRPDRRDPA